MPEAIRGRAGTTAGRLRLDGYGWTPDAWLSAQLGSVPSATNFGLPPENGTVSITLRGPPQSALGFEPAINIDPPSGEIP
jgi:hypothetical protein